MTPTLTGASVSDAHQPNVDLSIVMPCLNESDTIGSCIAKAKAALATLDVPSEIVIADNGSTDGSREIARELGARVVPVTERGYGSALMGGIAAARGRWIIMATTLTLFLSVWPRAYLLQVGDSRCYLLRNGELTQITRDQTMAQEMVDLGIMKPEQVAGTRLEHTLTSSIGGSHNQPTVTRFDMNWGHVLLLCSDGLTRHVSDDRIREVLRSMTSARQACETLLQEALDGGGTDNITVVVARAVRRH